MSWHYAIGIDVLLRALLLHVANECVIFYTNSMMYLILRGYMQYFSLLSGNGFEPGSSLHVFDFAARIHSSIMSCRNPFCLYFQVVIACVTPKYIVSHHCNRELSLSDLLRKPIIPIMYDKVPWPPPGGMALMFSQLVYINMKGE